MIGSTAGRRRWRQLRLPQVEAAAYGEYRKYERRIRPIRTAWTPMDLFVEDLWDCRLVYADPSELGFPSDVLGGLRPDLRKILVADSVTNRGQENMVKAHEGAHLVLHVPRYVRVDPGQGTLLEAEPQGPPAFYCRGGTCYANGIVEPRWMSREAEFFGACLLLPRDTFRPRAERRIHQAWREDYHGHSFPGITWFHDMNPRAVLPILSRAVQLLWDMYEGQVSRAVIRIRLSEIGLAPALSAQSGEPSMVRMRDTLADAVNELFGPLLDAAGTDEMRPSVRREHPVSVDEVPVAADDMDEVWPEHE